MKSALRIADETSLAKEIQIKFPEWEAGYPRHVTTGLEAAIFCVETVRFGPLAIKVPLSRHINNDNDRGLDARHLLRQDAQIFEHLGQHGFRVPDLVALYFGTTLDFLAYRYVQTDGSLPAPGAVGRLLSALHEVPLPEFVPVAHRGQACVETLLAKLTHERLEAVRRLSGVALRVPSFEVFREALTSYPLRRSLLHMDARAANLLCRRGMVVALIDWSNALVADPVLELARIAEYGWPMAEVNCGYGRNLFPDVPQKAVLASRLYTAAMLAVVFLAEAPDAKRGRVKVKRVRTLLDEFLTIT
jgi:hypothetical protein